MRARFTLICTLAALGCAAEDDEPPYVYADELEAIEPLASPRFAHAATLLPDGRVLIVGGLRGSPSQLDLDAFVAEVEIYDPSTGQLEQGPALATPRSWPSATLIGDDGRVVVLGGNTLDANNFTIPALAIEVWDPGDGSFSSPGELPAGGVLFHCVAPSAGELLVIDDCEPDACTILHMDPDSGAQPLSGRPTHRYDLDVDCVGLDDGRFLLAGGVDEQGVPAPYVELYDLATDEFEQVGPMSSAFGPKSELVVLDGGDVLILGDAVDGGPLGQIYSPATGEFTEVVGEVGDRVEHSLTLLEDGRVLIVGGTLADSPNLDLAPGLELFDPATGAFAALSPAFEPRWGHAAVRLATGPVLIVGGQTDAGHSADAFLFR